MARKTLYNVANINDHDKVIWRGPAEDLDDAQEKAADVLGLPLGDVLGWEDTSEK